VTSFPDLIGVEWLCSPAAAVLDPTWAALPHPAGGVDGVGIRR